ATRRLAQAQFEAAAAAYAASRVHAQGGSLARLVELLRPRPEGRLLDVATGAGHTALALAPQVGHAVGVDLSPAMLRQAAGLAAERGLSNLDWALAEAGALPFAAGSFDLLTCRIAAHHFPDVAAFLAEVGRLLRPGGRLGLVDNVVPGSHLRGKRGRLLRQAGEYVNAFERLRDPSHGACLSQNAWAEALAAAGLALEHQESQAKEIDFDDWTERMRVPPADRLRLEVMLRQAPPAAANFLAPRFAGRRIRFQLTEAIFIVRRLDRLPPGR
ncbi:MAG: class I SAM-dependent methyltransferase, partial [Candidatus Promineifilaceae bacterium]